MRFESQSPAKTAQSQLPSIVVLLVLAWVVWFTAVSGNAAIRNQLAKSLMNDGYTLTYSEVESEVPSKHDGGEHSRKIIGINGYSARNDIGKRRFRELAEFESLRRLQIVIQQPDESSFAEIGKLRDLEFLVLSCPPHPMEFVQHLVGLKKLSKLYLTQPVGDAGLAMLCQLKNLESLTISCQHITDEGIQQLSALSKFRFLKLHGSLNVSRETRRKLTGVVIDDGSFHRNRLRTSLKLR